MGRNLVRSLCVLVCLLLLAVAIPASGQQVGRNVNMVSGLTLPEGDPYLQRQNEPSIAVSTRNQMHLLAGSNDYRTVDVPFDTFDDEEEPVGDAWLSVFKSTDGGESWFSTLLPGFPQDTSEAGLASPLKGFTAAADAVVRAGANGIFYYSGIAFERNPNSGNRGRSAIFVARFIDDNNIENGDPFQLLDIQIVAESPTGDRFLDKSWVLVDVPQPGARQVTLPVGDPTAGPKVSVCHVTGNGGGKKGAKSSHTINISRSDFLSHLAHGDSGGPCEGDDGTGNNGNGKGKGKGKGNAGDSGGDPEPATIPETQTIACGALTVVYTEFDTTGASITESELWKTRSTNCGQSFETPQLLNAPGTIAQGASMAIDPSTGRSYIAWRQFGGQAGGAEAAIWVTSAPQGASQFPAPLQVAGSLLTAYDPFDQPSTELGIRTNAFPSIAAGGGFAYLVFADRKGERRSSQVRISTYREATPLAGWTAALPVDPIVDGGGVPQYGFQFMPAVAVGGGKVMVTYYDQRDDLFLVNSPTLTGLMQYDFAQLFIDFILDLVGQNQAPLARHTTDLRVAEAPAGPTLEFAPSKRVSRYLHVLPADNDPVQVEYNAPNFPLFAEGSQAFLGDYIDVAAGPTMVPDGQGGWEFNDGTAIGTESPPSTVFHAVWTDNRNVQPPVDNDWTTYTPPNSTQPAPFPSPDLCTIGGESRTGMRNQDVYTARISPGLVFTAPGNAKSLGDFQRAFVVFAQNTTDEIRGYRMEIKDVSAGTLASFDQFDRSNPETWVLEVAIAPQSSLARSVFVESPEPDGRVEVSITEIYTFDPESPVGQQIEDIHPDDALKASVLINPDPTNPNIINPNIINPNIINPNIINAEVYNPNIINPNIINLNLTNPNIINPNIINPNIINPNIINPNIINPNIINPNIINPNIINPNIINPNIINPNIINPNIINPNIINPNIINPNIINPNIINPNIINGSVTDVSWEVENVGNTTAAYEFDVYSGQDVTDDPTKIVAQLMVYQVHEYPAAIGCDLGVETTHELMVNVANPNIINPNITNTPPENPTIPDALADASFYLEPGARALVTLRVLDLDTTDGIDFDPVAVSGEVTPQAVETEIAQPFIDGGGTPPSPEPVATLAATTNSLPYGEVGQPYAGQLSFFGGLPDHSWSITDGDLPDGLALNSETGEITGIPTSAGISFFAATVTDDLGNVASADLSIDVVPAGLIAWWMLDETAGPTAFDATPNGNDGTIFGGVTPGARGVRGTAYTFDGDTGSYVEIAPNPAVLLPSQLTASVAVYQTDRNNCPKGSCAVFANEGRVNTGRVGYGLRILREGHNGGYPNGAVQWCIGWAGGGTCIYSASAPPLSVWTSIVGTYDSGGGAMALYVDGVLAAAGTHNGSRTFSTTEPLYIGRLPGPESEFPYNWIGSIDDLRIYDELLSAPEINDLADRVNPVVSTFDSDNEGWSMVGDAVTAPEWGAAYGNPAGGGLRKVDSGGGILFHFVAPEEFTGDQEFRYGTGLSFDLKVEGAGTYFDNPRRPGVVLEGAGLQLVYDLGSLPGPAWETYVVPLGAADPNWRLAADDWTSLTTDEFWQTGPRPTEAQFRAVLESLDSLWIRGEYHNGIDIASLDNVVLGAGLDYAVSSANVGTPYDTGLMVDGSVWVWASGSVTWISTPVPTPGNPTGGSPTGPDGDDGSFAFHCPDTSGSGYTCIAPSFPFMSLLAQVGDGPYQFVGSGPTQISGTGELKFQTNDYDCVGCAGDNSGDWDVNLSLADPGTGGVLQYQVLGTAGPTAAPYNGTGPAATGLVLAGGSPVTVTATGAIGWYFGPENASPNGYFLGGFPFAGMLDPNLPQISLLATVGGGPYQFVGSGPTVLAGSGELVFYVNDLGHDDNLRGSWAVTVVPTPQ